MSQSLSTRPHLRHLAKQAKQLFKHHGSGEAEAARRIRDSLSQFANASITETLAKDFSLSDAQLVVAREYGFESWSKLKRHVRRAILDFDQQAEDLVEAALSGNLTVAEEFVDADSSLASANIATACVLGDADSVDAFLDAEPQQATQRCGPRQWTPLLYVCFSRFLGRDVQRNDEMIRIARKLLDGGANPNAFFLIGDDPNSKQTALYGAAGIANDAAMTRLLLDAGADPNDDAPGLESESHTS